MIDPVNLDRRRHSAFDRARTFSPFLRGLADRWPDEVARFLAGAPLEILPPPDVGAGTGAVATALRRARQRLALGAALADLSGEWPLETVTAALSDFADLAIDRALAAAIAERVPGAEVAGLTVLALGKLGSRELNYSSDVDLILLYDPATLPRRQRDDPADAAVRYGRRLIELLQSRDANGYVARVDLRLRPSPEATPIALPVSAAIAYYESQALPWERAAFIRARCCAGDRALGAAFLTEIAPFVWRRALDFGAIDEIRGISRRIRDHYAGGQRFGPGFDLKRGRGGIREAEFFTQVQQLIHGGREPPLRAPATLDAVAALVAAGRLDPGLGETIAEGYRLLRTVEHRVQMIDDRQEHRLPEGAALESVAGLAGAADGAALLADLAPHVEAVGGLFDELVGPEPGGLPQAGPSLEAELAAMGWADPAAVARHLAGWRSGKARALRSAPARAAFEAMLPALLPRLAAAPDPERALNRFGDVVERVGSGVNLFRLIEARPALGETLALVLAEAPALADQLARRPVLLDGLVDDSSFAPPPDADTLVERFTLALADDPFEQALDRIRRLVGERRFALGVQLVAGKRDPLTIAQGYSDLAEAAVRVLAVRVADAFAASHGRIAGGDLSILAMGRFGGRALTHASDLDLIFLFDAPDGARSDGERPLPATDYYNRLASRIVAALSVATAAGPLYEVDTRLRPQGEQGMLAVSLAAFDAYQRSDAWTWEHLALCRARPLTGSVAFQQRVCAAIHAILRLPRDPTTLRAEAGAMRADMARHKPPVGPLDVKLGPGGLVDCEFTVHTLQLLSGVGLDPRLEDALAALAAAGLIDGQAIDDLRLLSAFLVVIRLVAPGALPVSETSRALVASRCGQESWDALVAAMDRARARIAARWERVRSGT